MKMQNRETSVVLRKQMPTHKDLFLPGSQISPLTPRSNELRLRDLTQYICVQSLETRNRKSEALKKLHINQEK